MLKKTNVKKKNKVIDFTKYKIYTITQQVFVGNNFYEGEVILYGKDEDMQLPKEITEDNNSLFKKIKGHIAVPISLHVQKQFDTIHRFNEFMKSNKNVIIKLK